MQRKWYIIIPSVAVVATILMVVMPVIGSSLKFGTAEIIIRAASVEQVKQFGPEEAQKVERNAVTLSDSFVESLPKLKDGMNKALERASYNVPGADKKFTISVTQAELDSIMNVIGNANVSHDSSETAKDFGTGNNIVIDRSSAIIRYGDNYYFLIINRISPA